MGPRTTMMLGLVAGVLLLFAGFTMARVEGPYQAFGWVLVVLGFLTLVGNLMVLRLRR